MAAWFIVPLGDPLLVDLAMALPFALLVASINYLVRTMTGVSGNRVGVVALPCALRHAVVSKRQRRSGGSVVRGWLRQRVVDCRCLDRTRAMRSVDIVLLGCAFGLLAGSKTTGVAAAGMLMVGAAFVSGLRAVFGGRKNSADAPGLRAFFVAGVVTIGAGGIWLVRNWIQFGSPLAPAACNSLAGRCSRERPIRGRSISPCSAKCRRAGSTCGPARRTTSSSGLDRSFYPRSRC
jgi:hypothetical protein